MSDDIEQPRRGYNTEDIAALDDDPAPAPRQGRRRWPWIILATLVVGPLVIFSLWAWIALSYSYSTSDHTGYIQKFSKQGWLCKTWEGELALTNMPGSTVQEVFHFSVRDDEVADRILQLMRTHDGRVSLTYDQHKAVPTSCFGDTEFFVTAVQPVRMPGATPTPTAVPAPAKAADSGR